MKKAEPEQAVEEQEKIVQEAENETAAAEGEQASSDEEIDEQTKALVLAVDSGDEDEQASGVIAFEEGQDVGTIPDVSKALSKKEKKEKKALKAASSKTKEETGVIYIGRLPHGFYEHEMKNYFSQFGPIRNLRVSRNKKTGRAKHFAFVEFEEASTAEIVAKTMDVSRTMCFFDRLRVLICAELSTLWTHSQVQCHSKGTSPQGSLQGIEQEVQGESASTRPRPRLD